MENIGQMLCKDSNYSTPESKTVSREVLNLCQAMILEVRTWRGIFGKEPSPTELYDLASVWAKDLRTYSPKEITEMFNVARQTYEPSSGPFGVPHILSARQEIERQKRQSQGVTQIPPAPSCKPHQLVDAPREAADPPAILGWRVCSNCNYAYPRLTISDKGKAYLSLLGGDE
jgi:hypothetical protein